MRHFLAAAFSVILVLPAWAEVAIKEVTSPGGITAWLVEDHSIPFVALELRFKGGASLDVEGKRGATNLMTGLLEEGAGDLDARGFARALEELASSFSYDVGDDALSVSARFLTETREDSVALLRSSIMQPAFDEASLARVRAQVLSGLASDAKDPNEIAGKTFDAMAFGDHPYATSLSGTVESVSALTRDDLLEAHRNVFARDRLYVGAVGDISEAELGVLLDALLGDLPATGAALPGPAEVAIEGGVTVVDFETPQSVALFGHLGMERDDPDFFAAYLMNQILGGGSFESRLMTEVREKRGLTYGVYSYLVPKDYAATYMGSVSSANDRIGQAVDVVKDEWLRMQSVGCRLIILPPATTRSMP